MTDRASAAAAAAAEGFPDLGRRYLDFIAHALEQGREAAAASAASAAAVAAAAAAAAATPAESRQRDGFSPTLSGGGLPESFIDVSVRKGWMETRGRRGGRGCTRSIHTCNDHGHT